MLISTLRRPKAAIFWWWRYDSEYHLDIFNAGALRILPFDWSQGFDWDDFYAQCEQCYSEETLDP
jgi:hypothetical protein